ncbi:arrestin domain-containing protein 17 [Bactrocera neohumeralis]|uniref:arrestin domain-containing protein 17 n=1 Tax=Bactrocera neohumeralis TaxID=98809 RepID=UPI002165780A|nr:arrestin domain-containing protein 17 [Bactrocera neohumeralis]
MVLKCEVHLDNPKRIYEPGDKLTGHVLLTMEVRLIIKAFAIKYTGFAEVKWERILPPKKVKKINQQNESEQPSDIGPPIEQCIEVYNNREDFLSNVNYFVGSEEATGRIIERGTYTYPFCVALPQSCPSSFESANGHIRYMVEVFIDHKNKREVWYTQQLQVLKPLDLRRYPEIAEKPGDVLVEENMSWHFFKHPLKMCVNLPQFGYVPGEELSIHVSIENSDKLRLHELTYELQQICCVTAAHGHKKTKTKYFHITLAKAMHKFCGPRERNEQHLQTFFWPQTVPNTDPADCQCLQIGYELSVQLSTSNAKRSLQAKIPIVVGTISLRAPEEVRQLSGTKQTAVSAMRSMENLPMKCSEFDMPPTREPQDCFAVATAPEPESPIRSACELNLRSMSFREAEHLPKTKFNAEPKKSKFNKEQTVFQPTYLYYDLDSLPAVQNAVAGTRTTAATTAELPSATEGPQKNASEDQTPENTASSTRGCARAKKKRKERKSILEGSS